MEGHIGDWRVQLQQSDGLPTKRRIPTQGNDHIRHKHCWPMGGGQRRGGGGEGGCLWIKDEDEGWVTVES